jgi:AsmA protein
MRVLLTIVGVIVLVVVIGLAIFAATFDPNRYGGTIQAQLEKQLGRKTTVGNLHLRLIPLQVRADRLTINDDPRFDSGRPFVQASELKVSPKLLPLLRKSVEIRSLELVRPSVELVKNRAGEWNFSTLGKKDGGNQPADGQQQDSRKEQFSLGELVIQDGQLGYTDQQAGTPRSVYDHIDATVRDLAPGRPFSIEAAAHLPGAGAEQVELRGQSGPLDEKQFAATPFHGTLRLNQASIAGLLKFLNSPAVQGTDGSLSGETTINSAAGKIAAAGQLNAHNVRVKGHDLGYPITAEYDLSDDTNSKVLTVRGATIKLGATPLLVHGTVDSKSTPAMIDANVKGDHVSLAEAARLAAASGVALSPDMNATGTADVDIHAQGPENRPALTGSINGRQIVIGGRGLAQPIDIPAINLSLTPSNVRSDTFNVISGGTKVAAQFDVQQYLAKQPHIEATVQAPHAALPALLAMARAYGVKSLEKVSGDGTLDANLHASGPVSGLNAQEIARTLNGTVKVDFDNVHYAGRDYSHELAGIAGFLGSKPPDKGLTDITKMTGDITIRNGVAETNDLNAELPIGKVGVKGTANLATDALNLRTTTVLSNAVSAVAGGTQVTGYMKTALANNSGQLVIPALVTGTFKDPKIEPDVQQVAQMKLKNLAPNFQNPGAALSRILGTDGQGKQPNPVEGLQKLLGGGK